MITITPTHARRLAITRQRLTGLRPAADADGLLATFRDLAALVGAREVAVNRRRLPTSWRRTLIADY